MELKKFKKGEQLNFTQIFIFGCTISFYLIIFMQIWLLVRASEDYSLVDDPAFPILRGMTFIVIYMWLLAWNVKNFY